jgi:serine/threonine protein kinase
VTAEFRQRLRNTEPPHTMMFNKDIEPVFIGKGVHGCAFKPPIQCSTPCNDHRCQDGVSKISKLMHKNNADNEMKIYSAIDLNNIEDSSKYFIANPYQCSPDIGFDINKTECPVKIGKPLSLLIYEDGGIDLYQYLKQNEYMKNNDHDFLSILSGLLNIFKGIKVLNDNKIFHFDVKEDNIVLGQKKDDYKLIDFGNAKKMPFFFNTVKLEHIERQIIQNNSNMNTNLETQLTQAFTPSRPSANATPSRPSASATPSRSSASTTPSRSKPVKMSITVKDPEVIFRILPVYQFFITQPFKNNNKPSDEDYELLADKFIEQFININDSIIKIIRYYYKLTGFFTDDNKYDNIKNIFDQLYAKLPEERLPLINRTLDIYSVGLLIFKITIYKYSGLKDSEMLKIPIIQFIIKNKLLDPNPYEHLTIDEIIENYEKFIKQV